MKSFPRSRPIDRVEFRGPEPLDMTGRKRPLPILDDHFERVEETGDGAIRGESGHLEYPENAGILCVLRDPLDGVFGRVTVPLWFCTSLVAEVSAGTCLSRDVFHSKMLASALTRVCIVPMSR